MRKDLVVVAVKTMRDTKVRTRIFTLAKLAISIACLSFAVRRIDLGAFQQDFQRVRWPWLCASLAQFGLIPILGGQRWRIVLNALGAAIGTTVCVRLFWIGMAFSQVLPSVSGGDAIRVVLAWRNGLPLSQAANSVLLERVAMMLTLIVLVVLIQSMSLESYSAPGPALLYPLILLFSILGVAALVSAQRAVRFLPKWRAFKALALLSSDSGKLLFSAAGIQLAILCFVTHLNMAVACLWLGRSVGMTLTLTDYLFYVSLVTLITTLPLSIGGWGIREGAIVALFGRLTIAAHTALAFSIIYGLSVATISATGVIGVWMSNRNLRFDLKIFPSAAETNPKKPLRC